MTLLDVLLEDLHVTTRELVFALIAAPLVILAAGSIWALLWLVTP